MKPELKKIDDNTISIFIPMTFKRRHGRATVMVADGFKSDQKRFDDRMIRSFVRAYKWKKALDNDPNMRIFHLAEREKIGDSYASRILRLNFVAPDIIEAIIKGNQPRDLKLQDFMYDPIPELWEEQREKYGF